jgi:hypothetical protein
MSAHPIESRARDQICDSSIVPVFRSTRPRNWILGHSACRSSIVAGGSPALVFFYAQRAATSREAKAHLWAFLARQACGKSQPLDLTICALRHMENTSNII